MTHKFSGCSRCSRLASGRLIVRQVWIGQFITRAVAVFRLGAGINRGTAKGCTGNHKGQHKLPSKQRLGHQKSLPPYIAQRTSHYTLGWPQGHKRWSSVSLREHNISFHHRDRFQLHWSPRIGVRWALPWQESLLTALDGSPARPGPASVWPSCSPGRGQTGWRIARL